MLTKNSSLYKITSCSKLHNCAGQHSTTIISFQLKNNTTAGAESYSSANKTSKDMSKPNMTHISLKAAHTTWKKPLKLSYQPDTGTQQWWKILWLHRQKWKTKLTLRSIHSRLKKNRNKEWLLQEAENQGQIFTKIQSKRNLMKGKGNKVLW